MNVRPVTIPCAEEFSLHNAAGEEYLIQVSWPLEWKNRTTPSGSAPIMYTTDGNALFMTASETSWRRPVDDHYAGGGVLVAIGYPVEGKLFDVKRRAFDLTPQPKDSKPGYGGAPLFLEFIQKVVRPAIQQRFPDLSFSREALYGHSFGGLFALHALFKGTTHFDCYIASSPSVWFDDRAILADAQSFVNDNATATIDTKRPVLMISVGAWEQCPPQHSDESDEKYAERKKLWDMFNMGKNAEELFGVLKDTPRLRRVTFRNYEAEEHTSVMAPSINRSVIDFFEDWNAF